MFNIMIWQFCTVIRFFSNLFKTNNVSFFLYQTHNFFLKNFCMISFLVHFSSFFFKSSVMENLVEFYKQIPKHNLLIMDKDITTVTESRKVFKESGRHNIFGLHSKATLEFLPETLTGSK